MKITTEQVQRLSTMYSAATSQISKSNAEASIAEYKSSAKVGLFGLGGR
jgi:hypothetical protein